MEIILLETSDDLDNFCSNIAGDAQTACESLENMANEKENSQKGTSVLFTIGFIPWGEYVKQGGKIEAFCYLANFQNTDIFCGVRVGLNYF